MTGAANSEPIENPRRSGPITVASILSWVLGGFILFGMRIPLVSFFWALRMLTPIIPKTPVIPLPGLPTLIPIALGIECLIFAALYIVAGIYLWRGKRSGKIIGIVAGTLGIISLFFPFLGVFSFLCMLPDAALIALIVIGWEGLTR